MFGEKDLAGDIPCDGENSVSSKLSRLNHKALEQNKGNPDEKINFSQKGLDFLRESGMNLDGFPLKPSKNSHNSGSQELTLRYLCENSKLVSSQKGKEVVFMENSNQDEKWVERDFLNLNESRVNSSSSKREVEEEVEEFQGENNTTSNREKRRKFETLNLSLSLHDVSLSLTASNALQNNVDRPKPTRSVQSLAPSRDHTQTTCSNDVTAASLSYSYSHPFSHNPSCSLTHNSTEYYDCSVGRDDQIWCGGEGTNGSVHSRFRPIGDGLVTLNSHGGGAGFLMMQGSRLMNKDSCNNSLYKTTSSDNHSFFPSELPARPQIETNSGDSRRRDSENLRGLESIDEGRVKMVSRPERILREIVSESIPAVAQIFQEISDETLESVKEYLKNLIMMPEKRKDLVSLQKQLERRPDLTKETLSKFHKEQLGILVAVKMGLGSFLSAKIQLPVNELVEVFLCMRCRNANCKSLLPVEDCDCKICSKNKGFCSSCMCPVCLNFDCANKTCSWVGCDVCSHWCHAACGLEKNLIKPGPSLKGPSGTSEMQFHCIGCGHPSEMFGFVKDVFEFCAKDWGLDTLVKELDCVRKIFKGSNDFRGKQLHKKADELVSKLENRMMSPSDACNFIIQFFNNADTMSDYRASGASFNDSMVTQASVRKDAAPIPPASSLPPKYSIYNVTSSSGHRDDLLKKDLIGGLKLEDNFQYGKLSKNDGFDSLESIIRIKEAEARMFQNKADEARREADEYKRMIQARSDKLEEEYAQKLAKLCLKETEERRGMKLEELKVLEDSRCDYYQMKLRMQTEIGSLLDRMEATKQQWV